MKVKSCFGIMARIDFNKIPKSWSVPSGPYFQQLNFQSFPLNLISILGDLISYCLKT
jgi:hypothetical protein